MPRRYIIGNPDGGAGKGNKKEITEQPKITEQTGLAWLACPSVCFVHFACSVISFFIESPAQN